MAVGDFKWMAVIFHVIKIIIALHTDRGGIKADVLGINAKRANGVSCDVAVDFKGDNSLKVREI